MKNIYKRTICFLLCIISIFSFSSCSTPTKYETIELYKNLISNISDYISINVYISDYSAIISEQTDSSTKYDVFFVVHIETSKKIDCTFKDVSITYSPPSYITPSFPSYSYHPNVRYQSTTLDIDGKSHFSYAAIIEGSDTPTISTSDITNATNAEKLVKSISGYVVVPKK